MLNDLPPQAFARRDEAPDQEFYRFERLVTHIDAGAVAVAVHRLRRRYKQAVRAEVAQTVATETDLKAEMRHLLASLE